MSKRRTQARRAAVAVLTGLAAFAALQLVLGVGAETWLPGLRDPLYATRLERIHQRLRVALEKPRTVVMLGSSRTQFGFRVAGAEKEWSAALGRPVAAFNFGVSGGGPLTELLNWRRLRRDGVRPDLLLVEVTPPMLAAQVPPCDFREDRLPADRLGWGDLSLIRRYEGSRRGLRADWLRGCLLPWYAHRFVLVSYALPNLLPQAFKQDGACTLDAAGGVQLMPPPHTPEERLRAREWAREEYRGNLSGFRLGGPTCDALRELLASCRRDGVPAALVVAPEGPTFRSWYPPDAWPAIRDWLDQLGREYGAPVVNAREWIGEDDFMDSHHLLEAGARRFTERLGRECIVPMLGGTGKGGP